MTKTLMIILAFIGTVVTSELLLMSHLSPQLYISTLNESAPLSNEFLNENCGMCVLKFLLCVRESYNDEFYFSASDGNLLKFSIESCTEGDVCNIVTKRNYTIEMTFEPSKL